ncbi:MAG: hypothetical protein LJE67_06105 [Salaquimonas sp.]|jgi:hypothetical protein|nr:hypothetical protein [Salaquimonas sp.]
MASRTAPSELASTGHDGVSATLFDRLDEIARLDDAVLVSRAEALSGELLGIGETVLEAWLAARGKPLDTKPVEGFRLLGLHRAGARGDPSFNACRETCRELVYRTNCARLGDDDKVIAQQLRLAAMVARHLLLFIDGKLETAGLGEFCCSSRSLRTRDVVLPVPPK